jgi:hypothetical protein
MFIGWPSTKATVIALRPKKKNMCVYGHPIYFIFGKKLLRACVYCYSKTEFK